MRIDDIDREIINALQTDGRASLREIARNLGIVEGTVRARLKRLQDERVVRIVAFADPTKVGNGSLSLIFLDVDPKAQDAVVRELQGWEEISYLSETLGETSLCAQAFCRDQEALGVLRKQIGALDGVRGLRLLPEAAVHKMRFTDPL